jgi:hypothetical protein
MAAVQAAVVQVLDAREGGRQLTVPLVKELPFGVGHRRRRRRARRSRWAPGSGRSTTGAPLVPLVAELQGDEWMETAAVPGHRAGDAPLLERGRK